MNRNERALAIEKQKADLRKGKSELSDKANKLEEILKFSRMMNDDREKRDMEIELKNMRRSIDKMLDEEIILTYAEIKLGKIYLAEIIDEENQSLAITT